MHDGNHIECIVPDHTEHFSVEIVVFFNGGREEIGVTLWSFHFCSCHGINNLTGDSISPKEESQIESSAQTYTTVLSSEISRITQNFALARHTKSKNTVTKTKCKFVTSDSKLCLIQEHEINPMSYMSNVRAIATCWSQNSKTHISSSGLVKKKSLPTTTKTPKDRILHYSQS